MQPTTCSNVSALLALCDLPAGSEGTIVELSFPVSTQEYLMRLGFVPGGEVEMVRKLPFRGPIICRTQGMEIAIRHDVAEGIFVHMAISKNAVSK